MLKLSRYCLLLGFVLCHLNIFAQKRDTIQLSIKRIEKLPADTVYVFSSKVDTIALQPLITDTSKVVKDQNPQDLEESKYLIKLMGSVRVNSYYDFQGMPNSEGFLPYDIPVGDMTVDNLSSVYIGARQTRLGIEGTANTKVGSITTYIEIDFASSTSSVLRLRHAYAEWNYFKLGHTWSTFMDNASLPTTVDFEGPNSALLKRHGVIRFEKKYGQRSIFGIAIEAPVSDYFNPADSILQDKKTQGNFDIAGRFKYSFPWGHIQLASILRRIDYLHYDMKVLYGWGILASSVIRLNPRNSIFLQYSMGEGIANYYVGFGSRKLDAIHNPNTNDMQLKSILGGFANYSYQLNPQVRFSVTGGLSYLCNYSFEPDDSFKSSRYIAVNTFYKPIKTIHLGLELTTGRRKNKDNATGSAERISLIAQFDF